MKGDTVQVEVIIKVTPEQASAMLEVLYQYIEEKYDVLEEDPGYDKLIKDIVKRLESA